MRIDRICAFAGSAPPSKPSMRMTAPGPAMSWSCCCSCCGIVRQRFDLLARQRRAEGSAARVGRRLLLVLLDGDRRFELRDRQHRHLLVLAAANPDVLEDPRLESGKLRLDRVAARREAGQRRDAGVGGLDRRGRDGARRGFGAGRP